MKRTTTEVDGLQEVVGEMKHSNSNKQFKPLSLSSEYLSKKRMSRDEVNNRIFKGIKRDMKKKKSISPDSKNKSKLSKRSDLNRSVLSLPDSDNLSTQ